MKKSDKQKPDIQKMVSELEPKPLPPLPTDLNNQILSSDPVERVRQLEWRDQQEEQRIKGV